MNSPFGGLPQEKLKLKYFCFKQIVISFIFQNDLVVVLTYNNYGSESFNKFKAFNRYYKDVIAISQKVSISNINRTHYF